MKRKRILSILLTLVLLLAMLPTAALGDEDVITFIMWEDYSGHRYINGYLQDTISNMTFTKKVVIVGGNSESSHVDSFGSIAAHMWFRNCTFLGGIDLVGDTISGYHVYFDEQCVLGENCEINMISESGNWFCLYGPVVFRAYGMKVDMRQSGWYYGEQGRERLGLFYTAFVKVYDEESGETMTRLVTGSERHYTDEGYFDIDVSPIEVSGTPVGLDVLEVSAGYGDISEVNVPANSGLRIEQTSFGSQTCAYIGNNTVYVTPNVNGDQFYRMDGGRLVVLDGNRDVNLHILDEDGNETTVWDMLTWRWDNGRDYDGYSVDFNGVNLPENAQYTLYLRGEPLAPEQSRFDHSWDGGSFKVVPRTELGDALAWPRNDDEAYDDFAAELYLPMGSVRYEPLIFGNWTPVRPENFANTLLDMLRWQDGALYEDYRENTALLCALWPELAGYEDGEQVFCWGGDSERLLLSFYAEKAGLAPGDYDNPPDDVPYPLAVRVLRSVWADLKGEVAFPEAALGNLWPQDWWVDWDMLESLVWHHFRHALNSINALPELVAALDRARETGGEVRVAGEFVVDAAGLAALAAQYPDVIDGSVLLVPERVELVVNEGAGLGIAADAELRLADAKLAYNSDGSIVVRADDEGGFYVPDSRARLRVDGDSVTGSYGLMEIDGTLTLGANSEFRNYGLLTVNGSLVSYDGDQRTCGYVDRLDDGSLRFTPGDWDDARGDAGWIDRWTGVYMENNKTMVINGRVYVGRMCELNVGCWWHRDGEGRVLRDGDGEPLAQRGWLVVNTDGLLEMNGWQLSIGHGYDPELESESFDGMCRGKLDVLGTLTTELDEGDRSHWNDGLSICNNGSVRVRSGGKLILGAFDDLSNHGWTDFDEDGRVVNRCAAQCVVDEGGELIANAADIYVNGDGVSLASLTVNGKVTLNEPVESPYDPGRYYWTSTIGNEGRTVVDESAVITVNGGFLNNYAGTWEQNGTIILRPSSEIGESRMVYYGRFRHYEAYGAKLTIGGSARIQGTDTNRLIVYVYEDSEYDAARDETRWLGGISRPDIGAVPENTMYSAWVYTGDAVKDASAKGFNFCVLYADAALEGAAELSFDEFNLNGGNLTIGQDVTLRADRLYVYYTMNVAGTLIVDGTEVTPENLDALIESEKIYLGEDENGNPTGRILFTDLAPRQDGEQDFTVTVDEDAVAEDDWVVAVLYDARGRFKEAQLYNAAVEVGVHFEKPIEPGDTVKFFLLGSEYDPKTGAAFWG